MARKSNDDLSAELNALKSAISDLADVMRHSASVQAKQGLGAEHPPAGGGGTFLGNAWRGSSYAFGDDFNVLSANMRTGMIGQPNMRTALQYASYASGLPARRRWEGVIGDKEQDLGRPLSHDERQQVEKAMATGKVDSGYEHLGDIGKDSTYARWRGISNSAGAAALGITAGQNAGAFIASASNLGTGPEGSLSPYLQVQGPDQLGQGSFMGNVFNNSAVWERKRQNLLSDWEGLTNYNWSANQEKDLRAQFFAMGVSPNDDRVHGALGHIRDLSRQQGISTGTLSQLSEPIVRRGSAPQEMDDFRRSMEAFAEAARKAGLNTEAAAKSLLSFSQSMEQRTGVNRNTAISTGNVLTKTEGGLLPDQYSPMLNSSLGRAMTLTAGSQIDPMHPFYAAAHAEGQKEGLDKMRSQFLMPMLGITNGQQIKGKDAAERYYMLKSTGMLDKMGMGGLGQQDFTAFLNNDMSKKERERAFKGTEWGGKSNAGDGATGTVKIELSNEAKKHFKSDKGKVILNFGVKTARVAGHLNPVTLGPMLAYDGFDALT